MDKNRLYFAYDNTINSRDMYRICPEAEPVAAARLDGYELVFWDSAANISRRDGYNIPGMVWSIPAEYEEILDWDYTSPRMRNKSTITVADPATKKQYRAMAYTKDARWKDPVPPTALYFGALMEGYCRSGFDTRPLYEAYEQAQRELNRQMGRGFPEPEKPGPRKNKSRGRER